MRHNYKNKAARARTTLAWVGMLSLVVSSAVSAATAQYVGIVDGDPDGLFDAATTAPDPVDGNRLIIGLDDFAARADGSSPTTLIENSLDTIAFDVLAPAGFFIAGIRYEETLSATRDSGPNGVPTTLAGGSWVVGGEPRDFDEAIGTGDSSSDLTLGFTRVFDFAEGLTSLSVSITNQILAMATGTATAEIVKESAIVEVRLAAIPIPPAVWLLGSALVGLVAVGRRRNPSRPQARDSNTPHRSDASRADR